MGWLQRTWHGIFNTVQNKDCLYFYDTAGRKIWYGWEVGDDNLPFMLGINHRGRERGHVKVVAHEEYLEIGDIVVYKDFPKYRNAGIGTKMFSLVVDKAKQLNLKWVKGFMHPEAEEDKERLKRFYLKQGCQIDGNRFWVDVAENRRET